MIEIIPAVMPINETDLEEKLAMIEKNVSLVQIDVMDGRFVKGRTWPYGGDRGLFQSILEEENGMPFWESLDFEIDLMVKDPEVVIPDWIAAGASRIIVHIESTKNMEAIIKLFNERFAYIVPNEKREVELCVALGVDTPTDAVLPFLEDIECVQFMGIDTIGVQGAELDERVLDKIHAFHNAHPEVCVSVDGGVSLDNARELIAAGAKRLVSGSAIFNAVNPKQALQEFKSLL